MNLMGHKEDIAELKIEVIEAWQKLAIARDKISEVEKAYFDVEKERLMLKKELSMKEDGVKKFLDKIVPDHDRVSCSDDDVSNGFFTRNGETWHGRCKRCMYLEIIEGRELPEGFNDFECEG